MNWPEDLEAVTAVGFSDALLSTLVEAIENDHVEWVTRIASDKTSDGRYSEFDYLGFRYAVDELYEPIVGFEGQRADWDYIPVRIEKIAKVDVDDDGNTFIVESYPLTKAVVKPKYEGSWGSF